MPTPTAHRLSALPSALADERGQLALTLISAERRKRLGQFFTPLPIARFMASLIQGVPEHVRLLDPGAGSGILACAACEAMARGDKPPRSIHVDAYEADSAVSGSLEQGMADLGQWLAGTGIRLTYRICVEDFVAANADAFNQNGVLWSEGIEPYDVVISNPPYFKVAKRSHFAQIASPIVHGQPNIYSIFMAAGAALLSEGGQLVSITPRSFASGAYFKRFRQVFFHTVRPHHVHLFGSRRSAFDRDEVLQEWVVLAAKREPGWYKSRESDHFVDVSTSAGAVDLGSSRPRSVPVDRVLDMRSAQAYFRIPLDSGDDEAVATVDSWPCSLDSLGLAISTGKVVPFRAREYVSHEPSEDTVPLLWMNHVGQMAVTWPLENHKPEYVHDLPATRPRLLVRDDDYILLRRFSAKEQARRLVAAPLWSGSLGTPWVGVENHVNYIYAVGAGADREMVLGLAILLNSALLDTYFRVLNGNTEVSSTEIRSTPLPRASQLVELGRGWREGMSIEHVDRLVDQLLRPIWGEQ